MNWRKTTDSGELDHIKYGYNRTWRKNLKPRRQECVREPGHGAPPPLKSVRLDEFSAVQKPDQVVRRLHRLADDAFVGSGADVGRHDAVGRG